MTMRNLAIRLSVTDAQKVKATLNDVGESGQRALQKIENASRPASKALLALDGATGSIRGALDGMALSLGPVGGALTRLGPAGLAAAAALGGMTLVMGQGITMAAEAERSYRRLEAVLNATGFSAGLTGRQITAFAEQMERTTLTSAEAVQEAAAVLATFRSVSGDTFLRTISLAQDMATVFGGTLQSSITQLGKALEDPIQGLTALRRVGISFSASQRDVIKALVDTGQQAEAQRLILDALEQQVGGAGAAEQQGLTGATNRLSDAWGNLLKVLGATPQIVGPIESAVNALSNAVETVMGLLQGRDVAMVAGRLTVQPDDGGAGKLAAMEARIAETQAKLATPGADRGIRGGALRTQLARQEAELAELREASARAAATARTEEERAAAGAMAAEAERRAERLAQLRADTEKELAQHATTAEKRLAIDQAYADKRRQLESLRTEGNTSEIDAALAREAELHQRQLASLEEKHKAAATAVVDRNARLIEQLSRQLGSLGDERQAFIDQALSRLSEKASAAQRAEVEKLAGALHDEKEAQQQATEAKREGLRLTEALLTPSEAYTATTQRLHVLLGATAITQETFNRAMAKAGEDLSAAKDRILRDSTHWQDGVTRAFLDLAAEAGNSATAAEHGVKMAFNGASEALSDFIVTGKADFTGFADSIVADITRIMVKQLLLNSIMSAFNFGNTGGGGSSGAGAAAAGVGSLIGGALGGSGAAPGTGPSGAAASAGAGAGGFFASVGSSLSSFFTSFFHEGGVVGGAASALRGDAMDSLRPDEVPAVLQIGELVLSRRQIALLAEQLGIEGEGPSAAAKVLQALVAEKPGVENLLRTSASMSGAARLHQALGDASLFERAQRYHAGGVAGTMQSGLPMALRMPAPLLSRQQTGRGPQESGRVPISVIMNITTPDTNGFRHSQAQIAADAARTIEMAQRRQL